MSRIAGLLAILLMIAAAVGLFQFKDHAAERAQHLDHLRAQISAERERISVLRAEWNYLNQPGRIQELAERHLELQPLDVGQIIGVQDLPMRPINLHPLEDGALGGLAGDDQRVIR